jgi:hypothetical protein
MQGLWTVGLCFLIMLIMNIFENPQCHHFSIWFQIHSTFLLFLFGLNFNLVWLMEFTSVRVLTCQGGIFRFEMALHLKVLFPILQRNVEEMFLIVELFQFHRGVLIPEWTSVPPRNGPPLASFKDSRLISWRLLTLKSRNFHHPAESRAGHITHNSRSRHRTQSCQNHVANDRSHAERPFVPPGMVSSLSLPVAWDWKFMTTLIELSGTTHFCWLCTHNKICRSLDSEVSSKEWFKGTEAP